MQEVDSYQPKNCPLKIVRVTLSGDLTIQDFYDATAEIIRVALEINEPVGLLYVIEKGTKIPTTAITTARSSMRGLEKIEHLLKKGYGVHLKEPGLLIEMLLKTFTMWATMFADLFISADLTACENHLCNS